MNNKLIAVVDDDPGIVEEIFDWFTEQHYKVKGFSNGKELFKFLEKEKPDLIILDLLLPNMDGFEICKTLRQKERFAATPIIILSGKSEETDKVSGLDLGADDYVVKPFSLNELEARVKAVLRRRTPEETKKTLKVGSMVIDLQKYNVLVKGEKINLTLTEFKILELLAGRKDHVFSRDRILTYLWGEEKLVIGRTIDVHIKHLREKMGNYGTCIRNVRGVGYKFSIES